MNLLEKCNMGSGSAETYGGCLLASSSDLSNDIGCAVTAEHVYCENIKLVLREMRTNAPGLQFSHFLFFFFYVFLCVYITASPAVVADGQRSNLAATPGLLRSLLPPRLIVPMILWRKSIFDSLTCRFCQDRPRSLIISIQQTNGWRGVRGVSEVLQEEMTRLEVSGDAIRERWR